MSPKFHAFLKDAEKINYELKASKKNDSVVIALTDLVKVSSEKLLILILSIYNFNLRKLLLFVVL